MQKQMWQNKFGEQIYTKTYTKQVKFCIGLAKCIRTIGSSAV